MRVHNNKIRLSFLTHCEYIYFICNFFFSYSFLFLYFTIGETAGISSRQTPQVETLFSLLSLSLFIFLHRQHLTGSFWSLSLSFSLCICYIPCCFHLILHIPSSFSWGVVIVVVWTNKKETIPHFVIQRRMSLMTIHLLLRL